MVLCVIAFIISYCQCYPGLPGCQLVCHCKNQDICLSNLDNLVCGNDGCQESWSGPSCQKQNIAYGLGEDRLGFPSYSQYSNKPSNAVDGNTSTYFASSFDFSQYLWINTGGYSLINTMRIKIDVVSIGYQIDVSNSSTFTDSRVCHKDLDSIGTGEFSVKCTEPLVGRYVRMQRPGFSFLEIYEFEIYECADYWFGDQCDRQCRCKSSAEICNKITGRCVSDCAPGYRGIGCQEATRTSIQTSVVTPDDVRQNSTYQNGNLDATRTSVQTSVVTPDDVRQNSTYQNGNLDATRMSIQTSMITPDDGRQSTTYQNGNLDPNADGSTFMWLAVTFGALSVILLVLLAISLCLVKKYRSAYQEETKRQGNGYQTPAVSTVSNPVFQEI